MHRKGIFDMANERKNERNCEEPDVLDVTMQSIHSDSTTEVLVRHSGRPRISDDIRNKVIWLMRHGRTYNETMTACGISRSSVRNIWLDYLSQQSLGECSDVAMVSDLSDDELPVKTNIERSVRSTKRDTGVQMLRMAVSGQAAMTLMYMRVKEDTTMSNILEDAIMEYAAKHYPESLKFEELC